jgi:general stress protein 26
VGNTERGDFTKLRELICAIRTGLLTTTGRDGRFHTRPVETLRVEDDWTLWFFTDWGSPKAEELREDVRVCVGYADPVKHYYVAVSGIGALLRSEPKARELWTVAQRAYFPDGPCDQRLALLCVRIEQAEYWIAPGPMSYLLSAAKAAVTGIPAQIIGENHKLTQ